MGSKIVAFVPARGGSERLRNKNLRRIGGVPLALRKIHQLLEVPEVDEVWLDSDVEELLVGAERLGARALRRPAKLASNQTDGHELFQWEASHVPEAKIVVQALATAPFIDASVMSAALKALQDSEHDSVFTVSRAKNYQWESGRPKYGSGRIPNSVDLEALTIETMGFYAVKTSSSNFPKKRIGSNPLLFKVSRLEALDIDDQEDFELALSIERGNRLIESQRFGLLKHHLSSAVLSDVAKKLGLKALASNELQLVTTGKLLGRARTMNLAPLSGLGGAGSEEWKQIYRGLDQYQSVNFGDVLCIGSGVQQRAYFGEVNAHLAIRAGASGAVVDSFTRDTEAVGAMAFPVFARGTWANDILYEGKVVDIGQPTKVGDLAVNDGDVIFADVEGVIVVPSALWPEVIEAALRKRGQEDQIKSAIVAGMGASDVLRSFGDF